VHFHKKKEAKEKKANTLRKGLGRIKQDKKKAKRVAGTLLTTVASNQT